MSDDGDKDAVHQTKVYGTTVMSTAEYRFRQRKVSRNRYFIQRFRYNL